MKKIKFFLDPINDLELWLNNIAQKGYRLKSVYNFIYDFEKTNKDYSYSVQFIGLNPSYENKKYIEMLKENGARIYKAPLNQGSIAFFKFRFRPYAYGDAKIANSFEGYNKEILIVENLGEEIQKLLTSKSDLKNYYKNIRNTYLYGFIVMLVLFLLSIYNLYTNNFEIVKFIQSIISLLVLIINSKILFKSQKNIKNINKNRN